MLPQRTGSRFAIVVGEVPFPLLETDDVALERGLDPLVGESRGAVIFTKLLKEREELTRPARAHLSVR